jgi:hypothetical protein
MQSPAPAYVLGVKLRDLSKPYAITRPDSLLDINYEVLIHNVAITTKSGYRRRACASSYYNNLFSIKLIRVVDIDKSTRFIELTR